ncbi:MAG: hypothetical protein FWG90_05100 [Oscillospiraceae bacterium]|nr:hypothetical protein [Oscillospiraceae bacterium]
MNPWGLALGAFIGTYFNNQKFRESVDRNVNQLIGKGLDVLNKGSVLDENESIINCEGDFQYET